MRRGEIVYIILNNQKIEEVQVIKRDGDSCLIRMGEYSGFWIHKSRLYQSFTEAKENLTRQNVIPLEKEINQVELETHLKNHAVWNGL